MRYSIMLQVVGIITFTLVSTAALFAWLQNRDIPQPETLEKETSTNLIFNLITS